MTTKAVGVRPTTPNVLRVFHQATPEEMGEGRDWYRQARALAEELASKAMELAHVLPTASEWQREIEKAVGVIAVLSPRLSWSKNVELARWIYGEHIDAFRNPKPSWWVRENGSTLDRFPGLKANGYKAIRILLGEKPEDVVSGPKVTAFYHAILNPNDPRGIVIDRHAFDVAVGRVMDDDTRGKVLGRKGVYEQFVRAYERAAAALADEILPTERFNVYGTYRTNDRQEWTPAEVQAVTWVAWRRLKKEGGSK